MNVIPECEQVDAYGLFAAIRKRIKQIYGTQRNFAKALGVSESHISDAMNSRCEFPRGTFEKLKIRKKTYFILDPIEEKTDA